jgi:predicted phage terminase large subunit-like protein
MATVTANTDLERLRRVQVMRLLERSICEDSLYEFARRAWPHITRRPFIDNWHIKVICDALEGVAAGKTRRLIINIPPRCMKSYLVDVFFPVWCWIHRPGTEFMNISHKRALAVRDTVKSRRLITSVWFQSHWGEVFALSSDQNEKMRYENDKGGVRMAQGMDSGITGEGGDIILIDDPHDRKQAHSEAERTRALDTFDEEISTRLNDPDTGAIVIIMQRLHELDLTGHVLAGEEPWDHLMLPMEFEPERADPRDPRTHEGELLWAARFTPRSVESLKRRLGSYGAAGQFQQRPSPKGGGIWKVEHVKACRRQGPRLIIADGGAPQISDMHVFNVADLAYSSKQSADYSVIGTFAGDMASGRLYLIDMYRARIDLMGTAHGAEHRYHLMSQRAKHQAMYTVVEHVSYSTKIVEFARREGEPIREVMADKDKVTRAYSAIPLCEAGQFFALHDAPWWTPLWAELAAFPNGAHDDMADVVAYGLLHWREMVLPAGVDLSVFGGVLTDYVP